MWVVAYLPEAERERAALPKSERSALINADAKLGAYGPRLGYPHTSAVRGARRRKAAGTSAPGRAQRLAGAAPGGRSAWRARACTGRSGRYSS